MRTKYPTLDYFTGTVNRRHLRVLSALWVRPQPREQIDQIAGASNGPELIAELRRRGLEVPCLRKHTIDRDGLEVLPGIYFLSPDDRRKIGEWKAARGPSCT